MLPPLMLFSLMLFPLMLPSLILSPLSLCPSHSVHLSVSHAVPLALAISFHLYPSYSVISIPLMLSPLYIPHSTSLYLSCCPLSLCPYAVPSPSLSLYSPLMLIIPLYHEILKRLMLLFHSHQLPCSPSCANDKPNEPVKHPITQETDPLKQPIIGWDLCCVPAS